jgi:hypothetical protein
LLSKLQETGNKFGNGGVGMTPQQAENFKSQYTLLDYTTNSLFDDPTGFNASLFQQ